MVITVNAPPRGGLDPSLAGPGLPGTLVADPLGIPPKDTISTLQQDHVKELANKLAWALGSTYRVNYSNMSSDARKYAWLIVKAVIRDHGYPVKLAKT